MPTDLSLDDYEEALIHLEAANKWVTIVSHKLCNGSRREVAVSKRLESLREKLHQCSSDIEGIAYHYFPNMSYEDELRLEDART